MWLQKEIVLDVKPYGFHLITDELLKQLPELKGLKVGLAHLLLQHTSAGITLNENADFTVRSDLLQFMNRLVPENCDYFEHVDEGLDDMPAHIKSSLLGAQLTVPVTNGQFNLGVWQGIYLGEYRKSAGNRRLLVTIMGETENSIAISSN
ncbi:secondary thiamine-phosphate synthase enzyme YjbQ [Pseudomonas sp. HK3]|jgi:secondary thiamine-phosphate synthase enzyme